jgi:hypothetical protein
MSAATKAGEVTDAMVKAARVWLTHLHMKRQVDVDNAVRNAIEAALEAALPPPAEPASAAEGALPAKALVLVTRNQLLNALAFMASEDDEIAIAETEDGLIAYSVDHPEETIDLSDEAPEPAQRASSGDAMALSASELDDFTCRLIERQVPFPPDIAMLIREHWDELFDDKPVAQSADTPSEALSLTADEREWLEYAADHVADDSEPEDKACERVIRSLLARTASRPQPARREVSEAEVEAAAETYCAHAWITRGPSHSRQIRAALEAAARVRASNAGDME